MLSIINIPSELLEKVFVHLDGRSFLQMPRVCTKWKDISKNVELNLPFWKHVCKSEISPDILLDLVGSREECGTVKKANSFWKKMYRSWLQCSLIKKNTHVACKLVDFEENNSISCVKVSGAWIITGHHDGGMFSWNQQTGDSGFRICQHHKSVSDFVFIDVLHSGPYGHPKYPYDHHHVVSVSRDTTMKVNSLIENTGKKSIEVVIENPTYHPLVSIKVFGDKMAAFYCNNKSDVYKIESDSDRSLVLKPLHSIPGPYEHVRAYHLWNNDLLWLCATGIAKTFTLDEMRWTRKEWAVGMQQTRSCQAQQSYIITKAFVFLDGITFLLTDDGNLLISARSDTCKVYHLMRLIQAQITIVMVRGSLLALGTDSGKVLLFHVPSVAHLDRIRLDKPDWSHTLSSKPVVSINIVFDPSPILLACTDDHIFKVKWSKKNKSKEKK